MYNSTGINLRTREVVSNIVLINNDDSMRTKMTKQRQEVYYLCRSIFNSVSILQVKLLEFFYRINEYIEYVGMDVLTSFVVQLVRAYNFVHKNFDGRISPTFVKRYP